MELSASFSLSVPSISLSLSVILPFSPSISLSSFLIGSSLEPKPKSLNEWIWVFGSEPYGRSDPHLLKVKFYVDPY